MNGTVQLSADAQTIIVRIPLRVHKPGGRKLMISLDARETKRPVGRVDSAILKALGRAYRWKVLLETGTFASINDLASAEKINHSYLRRLLRLTLLSPETTEMILDGRLPRSILLEELLQPFGMEWTGQRERLFGFES